MQPQLESYDPATGDHIGSVPLTSPAQVPEVVRRARSARPGWGRLAPRERAGLLIEAAKLLSPRDEELAELLCREMGKPLRRGRAEVRGTLAAIPGFAAEVAAAVQPHERNGALFEYRPLGVCAVISPWNYPLAMANNLIVPALVAGNTVIFKPSEQTPLIAQAYAEALIASLPTDVFQIVHGDREQGIALVAADVDVIAFTGSREAGRDIMRRAAGGLKRLVMELGGNDPMIVLPDADLEAAANFAVASSFENSGQMCTSTERIYVPAALAPEFEALVLRHASRYRMGHWNNPEASVFPLINETQRTKVILHIDDAVAKGARVLLGGEDHPPRYVRPTVLADLPRNSLMEREETFGPVVAIAQYDDVSQAIARANDSPYGLGAVVFGGESAPAVAACLDAGMVGINGSVGGGGVWVGAKQSGFGYRGGAEGHRQFTQLRVTS